MTRRLMMDELKPCREAFEKWWEELFGGRIAATMSPKRSAMRAWQAAWSRHSGEGEQVGTITDLMFDDPGAFDDCLNRCRKLIGEKKALLADVEKRRNGFRAIAADEFNSRAIRELATEESVALTALLDKHREEGWKNES